MILEENTKITNRDIEVSASADLVLNFKGYVDIYNNYNCWLSSYKENNKVFSNEPKKGFIRIDTDIDFIFIKEGAIIEERLNEEIVSRFIANENYWLENHTSSYKFKEGKRTYFRQKSLINYIENKIDQSPIYDSDFGYFYNELSEEYKLKVKELYEKSYEYKEALRIKKELKDLIGFAKENKGKLIKEYRKLKLDTYLESIINKDIEPKLYDKLSNLESNLNSYKYMFINDYKDLYTIYNTEEKIVFIEIPDKYKGLVIGKGGSNIKRLEEDYNIKIRIV